jgi:hypothetical protein
MMWRHSMLSDNGCNSLSIFNTMVCSSSSMCSQRYWGPTCRGNHFTNGIMVTNPILPSLMWPYHVCQICAIIVEHNPPSFSSKFLQLLFSFHHILFFNCNYCRYSRRHFVWLNLFIVFFPPPLNVHALKDSLTMSLMWLVLSILPPTCMEKEKGKKILSKSKN